jgi:3-oxoacyl-[acyl-carrier protein] reductase
MGTDLTGGPGQTDGDSHVTEISNQTFEQMLKVGLFGVLWTGRYAIPHMQKAGDGSIINISAASSIRSIVGRPAYQATKGAMNVLTRQMAVDYGPQGIRTNAIVVGFTPTENPVFERFARNEAFIASVRNAIPAPRFGSPVDIANGCIYLASEYGSFVNGVLLPIDGGYTAKLAIPDTRAAGRMEE